MTTQEISPYTEQDALAAWGSAGDEPWEDDGNGDIQPSFPIIKIVQPTSGMNGAERHVGEFYHSDSDTYTPEVSCVGLVKRDTRAYFQEGDNAPLCMSADGVAPLEGMRLWDANHQNAPQPDLCEQCPFYAWIDDKPPLCRFSLVVLVDRGDGDLAQLRISGKSLRPYRQFVSKKLRPKKLPLFSQRLVLSTEMKTEPSKRWAELVIESKTMTPNEAFRFNNILQEQRKRFEESVSAEGGHVEGWVDGDIASDAVDLPFE